MWISCHLLSMPLAAVLLLALNGLATATYYDDMLIEDLYKRLNALESDYLEEQGLVPQSEWEDNNIPLDSRDSGQADIRDQEYLEHSSNNGGFQYISGGAGEGQQHLTPEGNQSNVQEVKSDDALPFYCHPPNPCPKGFNAKDHGCHESVEDSADAQKRWIDGMMARSMCACDEEHMFSCPKNTETINTQKAHDSRDALDAMLDSLLGSDKDQNPFAQGSKRDSLVAKKSPGMAKRSVRVAAEQMMDPALYVPAAKENPYLQGPKLHIVAKKGAPRNY